MDNYMIRSLLLNMIDANMIKKRTKGKSTKIQEICGAPAWHIKLRTQVQKRTYRILIRKRREREGTLQEYDPKQ